MTLTVNLETGKEAVDSFALAGAFYRLCKGLNIDVVTVANMLMLEATNESNQTLYNSNCCLRSDAE